MSIGAKDHIDQMLVKKYSKEKMNNQAELQELVRKPETYWKYAKEFAEVQWAVTQACNYLSKQQQEKRQAFLNKTNPVKAR